MDPQIPMPTDPSAMALAWLQLAQADPRTLSPQLLQLRALIHAALNARMARDPYGIVSATPPGPSYQQQRFAYQQAHPPLPFTERFLPGDRRADAWVGSPLDRKSIHLPSLDELAPLWKL